MKNIKQSAVLLVTLAACVAIMILATVFIKHDETPRQAQAQQEQQTEQSSQSVESFDGIHMTLNAVERQLIETKSRDETPLSEGAFVFPLNTSRGEITSRFGARSAPELSFHNGLDLDANLGDEVVAAKDGVVVLCEEREDGYGLVVGLYHGGQTFTLYAHCSKLLVKVGDEVKASEAIALAGKTGYATGEHLHFEVIEKGSPQNPQDYI